MRLLADAGMAKLFNPQKQHISGFMDRSVFIHNVRQKLMARGITPRLDMLNALPSTREEMRRALNSPRYDVDKSLNKVLTKEQFLFAAKYFPDVMEIARGITKANPRIISNEWKGKVIVPNNIAIKIENLAKRVENDRDFRSIADVEHYAKSLRAMKKPSRANLWMHNADNAIGFFQYMSMFHENYEARSAEVARLLAVKTLYPHFSYKGRVSGPLSTHEGYQLYCKIAECNPLMHAHFEEIKIARGIRMANLWHDIHQDKKKAAKEKEAPTSSKPRKIKPRPRH